MTDLKYICQHLDNSSLKENMGVDLYSGSFVNDLLLLGYPTIVVCLIRCVSFVCVNTHSNTFMYIK